MDPISEQFHSILYLDDRFNLLSKVSEQFSQYSKDHAEETLDFLKAVIKAKKNPPTVKLQALKVISSLMQSNNKHIINYCGKNFFNRFKILSEYNKESKIERRGTFLFSAQARSQQQASEDFLILLLKNIKDWAKDHPLDKKGKSSNYGKLYNYLLSKGVAFPESQNVKEKEKLKQTLVGIKKNTKLMLELISQNGDPEKINRIGEKIKNSNQVIQKQINKYMDMEDHDLIRDLNSTLDLLNDGNSAFKAWKGITSRTWSFDFSLPPTCMFLEDLEPKLLPVPDELSDSIQEIQAIEESPVHLCYTDRDGEIEKEFTLSNEWTGLGADYCRLKDQLDLTEQHALNYQFELERFSAVYIEEKGKRENLELLISELSENSLKTEEKFKEKIEILNKKKSNLKEKNKALQEQVKDLQTRLDLSCQEQVKFKEIIENIESANKVLSSNCKGLEEEIEKHTETEKMLKNEIKKLSKKSSKKNTEKKTISNDSIQEVPNANEESPSKLLKFSLISRDEEEPFSYGPLSHEDAQSELNDLDFLENLTSEGYLKARQPTDKLSFIDNLDNFKELIRKKHGILYENLVLKISFSVSVSGFHGKVKIMIENKSNDSLCNLKTKIFSDPKDEILLLINSEKTDSLESSQIEQKDILFECKGIFQVFPIMKITFFIEGSKSSIVLLLPIAYTLFFVKTQLDLLSEWDAVEECIETEVKTNFDSIKKLARNLMFSRNLIYSYIEGNGVIIAGRSPEGVVLFLVILKEKEALVQVRSSNAVLRDLLSSMVVTQILPTI